MKWFRYPFALSGTRAAVPDVLQPTGDVSYEEGYGTDYSRDPVLDPLAKRIERTKWNQIAYDITLWIRDFTVIGTPDFITAAQNGGAAWSYGIGARVMFDDGSGYVRWESLVGTNTSSPLSDPAKWRKVGKQGTETLMGIFKVATSAQAAAMADDTVVMTPAKMRYATPYKAQVVFDGDGGVAIKSSFNVSGVVRESAGLYTISFATALPNSNYGVQISNLSAFGGNNGSVFSSDGFDGAPTLKNTTQLRICTGNGTNRTDNGYITCTIF